MGTVSSQNNWGGGGGGEAKYFAGNLKIYMDRFCLNYLRLFEFMQGILIDKKIVFVMGYTRSDID